MPYKNSLIVIGHLGRDAEFTTTSAGKRIAKFSVAVKNKFGDKETTDWVPLTWWSPYEDAGNWLVKGAAVYAEGRVSQRSYDNKEGKKVWVTECIVGTCYPFAGKEREAEDRPIASRPAETVEWGGATSDDVPFKSDGKRQSWL